VLKIRQVVFYKNYFEQFYLTQNKKVQEKILWTIRLIEEHNKISKKYLKHVTGTKGIYEIRVEYNSDIFRIFCIFDENNLIILMNGFQKKSQKTPHIEIAKAIQLKQAYESEK
jgi:phage-related protein